MSRLRALPLILPLILLGSCGGGDEPTTASQDGASTQEAGEAAPSQAVPGDAASMEGSLLVNGGFETGIVPWFTYQHIWWGRFGVTQKEPKIGRGTSMLELDGEGPIRQKERVASLIQELRDVKNIPKTLRGSYYVERWEPGLAEPWIEVSVSAFGPQVKPASDRAESIAWMLAGRKEHSPLVGNRREIPMGPVEVETGRWIDFEIPVWETFREQLELESDECLMLRVLATVRVKNYKKRTKGFEGARGKFSTFVHFDNFYLGE